MTKHMVAIVALSLAALSCRRGEPASVRAADQVRAEGALTQPAQQVACGATLCALGEVCCNPSCGICTARDGMCTQQFCDDAPPGAQAGEPLPPPPRATCETVRCREGTTCTMVEVTCLRAPCERVPRCVGPDVDAGAEPEPEDGGTHWHVDAAAKSADR
jgi:hypothetical protein